ncbi:MAG: aminotransferase class I/II-fold pyridoxal phosphate-dependent enzyme, partial [Methylococcales bacterium]|nr:aminotransferase class I/II-fold pyridoxal phosphate-dependent enzyme [Methylococcales bacterium]
MSAYKVADAKNLIKLDAMENPYTWPDNIKQEWLQEIKNCPINRYPDPEARQLVTALKESNQIPSQSEILLGNGSDEIIQLLLMSLPEKAHVLAPSPGFVMYQQV